MTDRWNGKIECCGNCAFWPINPYSEGMPYGMKGPHTDGTVSDCRRHAPREISPQRYPSDTAQWPTTKRDDCCGDFELRG